MVVALSERSGLRNNAGPDGDSLSLDLATDASGQNHSGLEIGNAYRTNPLTVLVDDDTIIINEHNRLVDIGVGGGETLLAENGIVDMSDPAVQAAMAPVLTEGAFDWGAIVTWEYCYAFATADGGWSKVGPSASITVTHYPIVVTVPEPIPAGCTAILFKRVPGQTLFYGVVGFGPERIATIAPGGLQQFSDRYLDFADSETDYPIHHVSVDGGPGISVGRYSGLGVWVGTNMTISSNAVALDPDIRVHSITADLIDTWDMDCHGLLEAGELVDDGTFSVAGLSTLGSLVNTADIDFESTLLVRELYAEHGTVYNHVGQWHMGGCTVILDDGMEIGYGSTPGGITVEATATFDVKSATAVFQTKWNITADTGGGDLTCSTMHTGDLHGGPVVLGILDFTGLAGTVGPHPVPVDISPAWWLPIFGSGDIPGNIPVYE